jgi:hypothetical protein
MSDCEHRMIQWQPATKQFLCAVCRVDVTAREAAWSKYVQEQNALIYSEGKPVSNSYTSKPVGNSDKLEGEN